MQRPRPPSSAASGGRTLADKCTRAFVNFFERRVFGCPGHNDADTPDTARLPLEFEILLNSCHDAVGGNDLLLSIFFQTPIVHTEQRTWIRDEFPGVRAEHYYLIHLVHLLVTPCVTMAPPGFWQQRAHRHKMLVLLRFACTRPHFMHLLVNSSTETREARCTDGSELFVKVLKCEGAGDVFTFLLEYDFQVGRLLAYKTHREFLRICTETLR